MKKELIIRPACLEDAHDIHRIRLQPRVMAGVSSMPDERIDIMLNYLKSADSNIRILIAELNSKTIGSISLNVGRGRKRHVGHLGMLVDENYHGQGIGSRLLTDMLNIADNFLNLVRIELEVFYNNENAISLYEKFGFVKEGFHKYAFIKDGDYIDVITMARYNERFLPKILIN